MVSLVLARVQILFISSHKIPPFRGAWRPLISRSCEGQALRPAGCPAVALSGQPPCRPGKDASRSVCLYRVLFRCIIKTCRSLRLSSVLFYFTGFGYQSNRNVCAGSVLVSLEEFFLSSAFTSRNIGGPHSEASHS